MNYLIIRSHPHKQSFCEGAADVIREAARSKGHSVTEIDLYADGFNPVMTADELFQWGKGLSIDPDVERYRRSIEDADILVFPFPVWWGSMPAMLKGFCDKVLLPGWAYENGGSGELIGLLTMKKAAVITTMESPTEVFESEYRNPIEGAFIKDTLQVCGIEVVAYMQIDRIDTGDRAYTEEKMKQIEEVFSKDLV